MSGEQKLQLNASITDNEMEYLLKELEIQFEIEAKARDRAEQMVQYLLTSLAAIFGATLILIQSFSLLPLIFASLFLIYLFCVSSFYRTCRLRNTITQTRLARHLIRRELHNGNVKQAFLLLGIEEGLTGFSWRIRYNMYGFAMFCGLVGASLFAIGGIILLQETSQASLVSNSGMVIYPTAAIIGFLVTSIVMLLVLRHFNRISTKLLKDQHLNGVNSE